MQKAFTAAMLLLGVAGIYGWRAADTDASYVRKGEVEPAAAAHYWQRLISKVGPEAAHARMLTEAAGLNEGLSHPLAHSFGAALYAEGGLPYAKYCGTEFMYGCYHQLLGLGLAEHGSSAVRQTLADCDDATQDDLSCAHGLGHALLGYFGYTPAALEEALGECRTYAPKDTVLNACASGVFMEYNLREIASGKREDMRAFSAAEPYAPCLTVAPDFKDACAYQLPLWWRSVMDPHPSRASLYGRIGALCRGMGGLAESCWLGLGIPADWFEEFTPERVSAACAAAGVSRQETLWCLSGAARGFRVNASAVADPCRTLGLSGTELDACVSIMNTPAVSF